MLAEVATQGFSELRAAPIEGAPSESNPIGQLKRAGYAYVAFALRWPEHFSAMFDTPESGGTSASRQAGEEAFATFAEVIDLCQREGQLPAGGTQYRALLAWSLVHGIAKLAVSNRLPFRSHDEILQFSVFAVDASIASLQWPLDSGTVARAATNTQRAFVAEVAP